MEKRTKLIVGAVAAVAVIGVGAGVGVAAGGDLDKPLRGSDYDRATTAALEHVGEGTVVETEVGDDAASYEVEIRLDDGTQVEVQLDDSFEVMASESDDDGAGDVEETGDDD
jgi:hypothetical protein